MALSARQLNRATLDRQLLLCRESIGAREALRRIVAVQSQAPASPYLALWNRVAGFDAAELDAAFATGAIVKATLMRIALHAVAAEDYPEFHAAMQPTLRAARLGDRRFVRSGLSTADADALVAALRTFTARPRTAGECEAWVDQRVGELPKPGVWWALRAYAPLLHAVTGGPWSFGSEASYVAAPAPDGGASDGAASDGADDRAARHLVRRYLEGFGPASASDVAQFVLFPRSRTRAREVLAAMADDLVRLDGPDGAELYDVPDAAIPAGDVPGPPRLMAMWDSTLLAYADRGRIIPPAYRPHVTRRNGDVLPTLLVDGYVAGVWRPVDAGIEATAFHRLPEATWRAIGDEAAALLSFLADRDPGVYRRHEHWWARLPAAEVRVLTADGSRGG